MRYLAAILVIIWASSSMATQTVGEILDHYDKLYRSSSSFGEVEMTILNPNWQRTLRIKMWTMGMDKTFIRILAPKKDAGIATLRIGNDMWNFFPKINKVLKVPPSMRMGSWMGSDFTNDDLVKETTLSNDYHSKFGAAVPGFYIIELSPKEDTVSVWGKIVLKVKKSDLMPVEQIFYNERGEKTRIMNFKKVKSIGGKTMPVVMELVSLKKEGYKTIVEFKEIQFDKGVGKSVFTRRNLTKRR